MPRRWTGDRFLGSLGENEEAPFLDFDGQAAQRLQHHVSEETFKALTSVAKVPYDPTTGFFGEKSLDKTPNSVTVTVINLGEKPDAA